MLTIDILNSSLPLWIVLIPLIFGIMVFLSGLTSVTTARFFFILSPVIPSLLLAFLYKPIADGGVYNLVYDKILPPLGLSFRIDILSMYMLLVFCALGLILFLFTLGYMKDKPNESRFLGSMVISFAGCLGVVMAGDLMSFFLFFELMSVIFIISIAHEQTPEAIGATMKFFFMTIISSVSLFLAIVLTYQLTGSASFGTGGLFTEASGWALVAFIAYIICFGIKTAMLPLHLWMPDAYTYAPVVAGTLSSGMLLKVGAYGMIRVFYDIYGLEFFSAVEWNQVVVVIACITIVYGSINAIAQDDIIRRLAYSGIAQIGYIIVGIALLTEASFIGNIYHIFAHAAMKGCLFLCAAVIITKTGKRLISEMSGIGFTLPFTMLAFTIASITAVGLPPFNVFITKWHLGMGALEVGQPFIVFILLISSVMNAAYYLPIVTASFLGGEALNFDKIRRSLRINEAKPVLLVPIAFLALGCFYFALSQQNWPLELAKQAADLFFVSVP